MAPVTVNEFYGKLPVDELPGESRRGELPGGPAKLSNYGNTPPAELPANNPR